MKTKVSLHSSGRVPIGTRLLGRLKPLGLMRLWLLVVLLGWSSSAFSWYVEEFNNMRTQIGINGDLHYKFDMRFFVDDYDTDYYRWDGDVWLKVDGVNLCKLNEVSPIVTYGSGLDYLGEVTAIYQGTYRTKKYNISGVTNVYVSIGNYHVSSTNAKDCYVEVDVCFERNYMSKNWAIGISGYWHYNATDRGRSVNKTIFNTSAPSGVMPSITSSNFTRSNKKINLTYPGITTNYSGWTNSVMLYKEDCSNVAGVASYGTYTSNSSFNVSDNYTPVTLYPRFEFLKANATVNSGGGTNAVRFDKDYGAITIPGQPRPKNVGVQASNTYSKQVTLAWDRDAYNSSTASNGQWVIFRKEMGKPDTQIELGRVNNGVYTYTDKTGDLAYGTTYTYTVCYCPNGWTVNHEDDAYGLSGFVRYPLNRDFAFSNVKAEEGENNIVFSWNHSGILDASNSKKYSLYVQRSDDGGTTWNTLRTDEITSKEVTSGTFTDADVAAHKQYKYRLKINVQENDFTSDVASATITSGSKLTGFSASRGNYTQSVKLTWTVNQVGTAATYFTLQRRPLGSSDESDWYDIYTTSGTATTYSYEDQTAQPGSFNEYRVKIYDVYEGNRFEGTPKTTDGFCIATGVVGGRITYGSGTAVEGAKVTLSAINADGNDMNNKRSIKLDGSAGQGFKTTMSNNDVKKIFNGNFTVQMWVNPDTLMPGGANKLLLDVMNTFSIYLEREGDKFQVKNWYKGGIRSVAEDDIPSGQWTHLTFVYDGDSLKIRTRQNDLDWMYKGGHDNVTVSVEDATDGIVLGNSGPMNHDQLFAGYVDEVRIFNRALTDDEIKKNYNHTLTGSEEGLVVYWPFDEGMENQTVAYDFSKKNGISNGHHAIATIAAHSEANIVPNDDQLSLMAYTDKNGNYSVAGIPFSGEGTSYTITPTLGVHKFNPGNEQRFVNMNALVHSGVNFEDVSSFNVSGAVYYANTTIPVADATLKVDGITASRDGKAVTTNSKGEFSLDVPIGDHFISVEKIGHTFVNGGRYPEDLNDLGLRITFEESKTGLTFYDNTLVTVAGRVAGGDIEYDKPVGLDQGHANIGKAVLTLELENADAGYLNAKETIIGNAVSYGNNTTDDRVFDAAFGTALVLAGQNYIKVETDPVTGEFAAQLPPLRYKVSNVTIPTQTDIIFNNLPVIDATNPSLVYSDSIETNNGVKKFEYVGLAKIKYKSEATFKVTENEDGSFGMKEYIVREPDGKEHQVAIYEVDPDNGNIDYKFGHPVYEEMDTRTFHFSAKELYKNKDGVEEVVDEVPLAGKTVTVQNPFASTAKIVCTNGNST